MNECTISLCEYSFQLFWLCEALTWLLSVVLCLCDPTVLWFFFFFFLYGNVVLLIICFSIIYMICFSIYVNKTGLHCVIYWFIWKFCPHVDVAIDHVLLFVGVGLWGQWGASHCFVLLYNVFSCLFNDFLWLSIYY